MAGRISCCLNLPFPNPNSTQSSSSSSSSSPLLKTTSQISRRKTEQPKKNSCSLTLSIAATIMVGAIQIIDVASVEATVVESPKPRRWSDKRTCPAWLGNSLETIVPENLPRPSSHRRLELAGISKGDAPPVGAVVTRGNKATSCFSL